MGSLGGGMTVMFNVKTMFGQTESVGTAKSKLCASKCLSYSLKTIDWIFNVVAIYLIDYLCQRRRRSNDTEALLE